MKVLNVIPGLATNTGGPAFAVVNLAKALADLGVEVTVFTTDVITPVQARERRYGLQISDMPAGADSVEFQTFPVAWPRRLLYSPKLRRALSSKAAQFDIVHIHSLFLYPQFAAFRAAQAAGTPFVVSPRGSLDPFLAQRHRAIKALADRLWQRSMLKNAAVIHVTAEGERAQLESLGYADNLRVCPNGIGSVWFDGLPSGLKFREQYLGGFAGPLVLFHGRLTLKKGLDVLLEAILIVRNSGLPAQLALVGPDDEGLGRVLRAKAEVLGLSGCVTFVGLLEGEGLREALSAADVWAMPSHGENFGIGVAEALATALPVVISPEVNIADEINGGKAGLVAERTPEAFASAIGYLLEHPQERGLLGARARAFSKNYSAEAAAARMYSLYEEILSKRTSGEQGQEP